MVHSARVMKNINVNSKYKFTNPQVNLSSDFLGKKLRRFRPIVQKKKFLLILLNFIAKLPLAIYKKKIEKTYISEHEKYIRKMSAMLRAVEAKMEERRLLKIRVRREKFKKKQLADPANIYTEEQLDEYLFGTSEKDEEKRREEEEARLAEEIYNKRLVIYNDNLNYSKDFLKNTYKTNKFGHLSDLVLTYKSH